MLVVEQGHTIDAQRNLIRQLFSDSTELTSMKGKAAQQKQRAATQGQANPQAQGPIAVTPAKPEESGKGKSAKNAMKFPKPPRDASEMADERRSLLSI